MTTLMTLWVVRVDPGGGYAAERREVTRAAAGVKNRPTGATMWAPTLEGIRAAVAAESPMATRLPSRLGGVVEMWVL